MNENKSFSEWLKYKMKVLSVSDGHFFRFIWITAIAISVATVLISAGVKVSAENKEKKAAIAAEEKRKAEEAEAALASLTEAKEKEKASKTNAISWMLIVVNLNNPLPDNFEIKEFTDLVNGHKVDKRIYPDLQDMFDSARADGQTPSIVSSYITPEEAKAVALPCALEHSTGLCVDITSSQGEDNVEELMKWVAENGPKFGFIIRYPDDKYSITGVKDAKTHLRYVGKEAAQAMKESGQCLEEYVQSNQ